MKVVWKKFKWQKIGRFWLYYFHPAYSDWRYTSLHRYWRIKKEVAYWKGWNQGFKAGKGQ